MACIAPKKTLQSPDALADKPTIDCGGFSGELKQSMRPAMKHLVELEGRIDLTRENIEANGLTDERGELRGMVPELRQSEKLLLAYYEAMGMTPSSFYAIRRNRLHGDVLALARWAKGEPA